MAEAQPPPEDPQGLSQSSLPSQTNTFSAGFSSKLKKYFNQVYQVRSLEELGSLNEKTWDTSSLGMEKIGSGAVFGFISGYTCKTAFRTIAFVAGLGFLSLQALAYTGYIKIKWDKLEKDVHTSLDIDGDSALTLKDVDAAKHHLTKVLTWGMPSAGGFGLGFLMGFRFK
eukprot:GHVR01051444.1.p1 GENE.GHVR01051444.1~~GHVR01051444.1.p1  ORF type:complete len:170 (-),score=37.68 GHVR01051444.1:53-562(-)